MGKAGTSIISMNITDSVNTVISRSKKMCLGRIFSAFSEAIRGGGCLGGSFVGIVEGEELGVCSGEELLSSDIPLL